MKKISYLEKIQENVSLIYKIRSLLIDVVKKNYLQELDFDVTLNIDDKCDISTNLAFKLAKKLHKSPIQIAESIKESLDYSVLKLLNVSEIEIINGYINFNLDIKFWIQNLYVINEKKEKYGYWNLASGTVMVEFGQPNTHKAVTAGHIKSAVTGLAVCRLLEVLGYKVIKANYYSDIGLNVAKTTWAFMNRQVPSNFDHMDLMSQMEYIADCYVWGNKLYKENENIKNEIRKINKKIYSKTDSKVLKVYNYLKEISIKSQNEIFNKLGVVYDRQYSESETVDLALHIVQKNLDKVFKKDNGSIIFPGEKYNLNRWVFINSINLPTYSAKDLGLAYLKFKEYPDLLFCLVLTSVEQLSYFEAVIKALELVDSKFINKYYNLGFGWLLKNNKKMNSKSGNAITVYQLFNDAYEIAKKKISVQKEYLDDEIEYIAEKVFLSGIKFLFLSREFHLNINYNPDQFLDPKGFSGPYVLYAYVRSKNILQKFFDNNNFDFSDLTFNLSKLCISQLEVQLLKILYKYEYVTYEAAKNISPHLICNYLFELSKLFNIFYKKYKVINTDNLDLRNFRIFLTMAISIVLKNGLYLLGIDTIEKM